MERKIEISKSDYALDFLARCDEFRKAKKHCDFIILAGEKEIPVHRFVISASSEYFDAMLTHDTKENSEGIVEIQQANPDCIVKCVEFMYTGEAAVSEENQRDLMHVAHMLRLTRLYNGIAVFLEQTLNCSSFFSTREIANLYDCENLGEVCNEFALKNFRSIARSEEFKQLEADYLKFLLSSDTLQENDTVKCKALMLWINYDSDRASALISLLKTVDFSNIPLHYRKFIMESEPAVAESLECLRYVMESLLDSVEAADVTLDETSGIIVFDSASRRIKHLNLLNRKWKDMQGMPENTVNQFCSVEVVADYMYVFVKNLAHRIRYRDSNAVWEQLADRSGCGDRGIITSLHGVIYIAESGKQTDVIEQYIISQDRWSVTSPRSTVCANSTLLGCQDNIYAMGGYISTGQPLATVERYHPNSCLWFRAPSLCQARELASAATLDRAIYLFGGYCRDIGSYVESVEILYNDANSWVLVILNGFKRFRFTSHGIDGKIYLVGNDNSNCKKIDKYDPSGNKLETVDNMPNMSVRCFASTAAMI